MSVQLAAPHKHHLIVRQFALRIASPRASRAPSQRMSKKRSVSRAFLALTVITSSLLLQDAFAASLALQECRLESPLANGSAAAQCGVLNVPENPADPGGKRIEIHIAVVRALRVQPEPDPLFLLSGGPGQAASDMY